MPKTMTRPSDIEPDEFEPDFYAELAESLAEPLDCELGDPPVREPKRDRMCRFVDERQMPHEWALFGGRPPKPSHIRK
jgi:hypothetical protein